MARTVSLNKRFNRGVPARAYIKHLHVYTLKVVQNGHDTQVKMTF